MAVVAAAAAAAALILILWYITALIHAAATLPTSYIQAQRQRSGVEQTHAHTDRVARALASRTSLVQAAARPRTGDREWPDSRLRVRTRNGDGAVHLAARDTPHSALLTLYSLSSDFNNFSVSSLQYLCIGVSRMWAHCGV